MVLFRLLIGIFLDRTVTLLRGQKRHCTIVIKLALAHPLHVSDGGGGGVENVGCTLRDFQNYYRDLMTKIKDVDVQMFVAQLEQKKEVNSAFL
jgi:hypothetical protein